MSMLSPAGGAKSVTSPVVPSPGAGTAAASGGAVDLASSFANLLRGSIAPQPAAIAPVSETTHAQAAANKSAAKAPAAKANVASTNAPSTASTVNPAPASTPVREPAPAEAAAPPSAATTPAGRARRAAAADERGTAEADTAALHKLVMAQLRGAPVDATTWPDHATAATDQPGTDIADAAQSSTPAETSNPTERVGTVPDAADDAAQPADQVLPPDAAALAAQAAMTGVGSFAVPAAAAATEAGAAVDEATTASTPCAAIATTSAASGAEAASLAAPEARSAEASAEARAPASAAVESRDRGPDAGVEMRAQPEPPAMSAEAGRASVAAASAARTGEAAEPGKAPRNSTNGISGDLPMPTPMIVAPPQFALPRQGTSEVRQITLPQPLQAPEFTSALAARVSVLAVEGVQQAQLHLNPAEMGPVSVQINVDGQQAQVAFHAEQAETRQVLEQSLPELAAALRESGLTLSGGGVFQQMNQQARDARPDARQAATAREFAVGDNQGAQHDSAVPAGRAPRGMLDLYA